MSARPRIGFASCDSYPELFAEEKELVLRSRARGFDAEALSWSAPATSWDVFDAVVIRSTWDYFERPDEFRAWLDRLEKRGARVQNPLPLIRWNMDKLYLLDLAEQGVKIVPTKFVRRGERFDLAEILAKYGWADAVLKPTVSGNAHRTERINASNAAAHQAEFERLSADVGAMVQPFVPEIVSEGEWSLHFFGGAFSHAVIKRPVANDYRVQASFGGRTERVQPSAALIAAARKVLNCAPERPVYARVDGVRRGDELMLMELEVIEPYLYFADAPEAIDRFLDALLATL